MRLTMSIKGQLNYRDIVVPIDVIGQLRQLGKVKHNINLNRWEIVVPTRRVFDEYLAQFRPKRSIT